MKITIYKKYEYNISIDEIERLKKEYKNNPKDVYNLSDKNDFIPFVMNEIYEKDIDYKVIINEKDYHKFCEKWKKL